MNYDDKILLRDKLKTLEECHLYPIYHLIKDTVKYTQNNKGILFSSDQISDELLEKINNYVKTLIKIDP